MTSGGDIADELRSLFAEQQQTEEVREQLREVAEEAAAFARDISPVESGDFRDSIHVEPLPDIGGVPAFAVVSDDPSAPYIEYGTNRTPEFGVFAKTEEHFNNQQ